METSLGYWDERLERWDDCVRLAVVDLLSKGFEDVTREVELYPGDEELYVFRSPDGVLYHCWHGKHILNVLAESRGVALMLSRGVTDTHFCRDPDGVYHCDVRWDVVEVV